MALRQKMRKTRRKKWFFFAKTIFSMLGIMKDAWGNEAKLMKPYVVGQLHNFKKWKVYQNRRMGWSDEKLIWKVPNTFFGRFIFMLGPEILHIGDRSVQVISTPTLYTKKNQSTEKFFSDIESVWNLAGTYSRYTTLLP